MFRFFWGSSWGIANSGLDLFGRLHLFESIGVLFSSSEVREALLAKISRR